MADAPEVKSEKDEAKGPDAKKESGGFLKFWTSLPGVLTGIAAVVAAVVSLVALFHHEPSAVAVDPPAVQASNPGPSAPAPASGGASTSAGTGGSAGVLAQGSLTMGVNEHADLAAGVVSDSGTANRHNPQFFLTNSSGYQLVTDAGLALAVVDGAPDRATCLTAVTARQVGQLALSAAVNGKTVCVLTDTQQVAALSPTALPAVGTPRFAFDYVLWS